MSYAIITESDVSQWSDKTGSEYHFPKRYAKVLTPGTTVVYYKGKLKDKAFREKCLSDEPHYFGFATIEQEPYNARRKVEKGISTLLSRTSHLSVKLSQISFQEQTST